MQKEGSTSKYVFLGLIGLVALVSVIIIFPFLTSVLTGALLAFLFYPLYTRLQERVRYKGIAAFIVAIVIVLLIAIPAVVIVNSLTTQTHYMYIRAKQHVMSGELIEDRCYDDSIICNTVKDVNNLLRDENIKNYLVNMLNDFIGFLTKRFSELVFSLPAIVLNLLVMLFTTYYLLKDGKELIKRITRIAPLKVHHQDEIITQFGEVTKAVIYGSFIVALVQGTLGAFGLWFFGVDSFLWWAIVMTFFALIPFIGTWIVWLPASGYLTLNGYLSGEHDLIWKGIGLFFYGLLIISTIDNILKPFIVAGKARVHPFLIFIGIIGGLFVFGFVGIFLGPLVLAMFQTLLHIYECERAPHPPDEACILGRTNNHKHKKK